MILYDFFRRLTVEYQEMTRLEALKALLAKAAGQG